MRHIPLLLLLLLLLGEAASFSPSVAPHSPARGAPLAASGLHRAGRLAGLSLFQRQVESELPPFSNARSGAPSVAIGELPDGFVGQEEAKALWERMSLVARLHYAARRQIKQDNLHRAREVYMAALREGQDMHSRTYLLLALLEQRAGSPDRAREVFRLGVRSHPLDPSLVQAALGQAWGLLESKMGPARRAALLLRRAVSLNPESRVLRWKRVGEISQNSAAVVSSNGKVVSPRWIGRRVTHTLPLEYRDSDPGGWVMGELERLQLGWAREMAERLSHQGGGAGAFGHGARPGRSAPRSRVGRLF